MKNIIIYIILIFSLFSCDTLKEFSKNKTNTDRTIVERSTTITKRPKDSVVFVPNYIFKDTTIVKRGKTTTLRLDYDSNGVVTKADCTADELNEIKMAITQINESINSKEKDKKKETSFKSEMIIYIFLGLAFLMIINKISNKSLV